MNEYASRRLLMGVRPCEDVRPDGFEVHAPGSWDAGLPPVRNGRIFDLAQPCYSCRTAQGVDDVGVGMSGIHLPIIRHALFSVKAHLTTSEGMSNSLRIRIAE